MGQVIVFQMANSPASIMVPAIPQYVAMGVEAPVQLSILQIGQKDVPDGLPFWIVDAEALPTDRAYRNAWTLDVDTMGEPDGVGNPEPVYAWVAEQQRQLLASAQQSQEV